MRATWVEFLNLLSRNTRLPGVSSSKAHVPQTPLNTPWLVFSKDTHTLGDLFQPTNFQDNFTLICVRTLTVAYVNLPQAVSKVYLSWLCWCATAMPALRRQRQYDQRFQVISIYRSQSGIHEIPFQKMETDKQTKVTHTDWFLRPIPIPFSIYCFTPPDQVLDCLSLWTTRLLSTKLYG